tara:strand:- start:1229 stop:1996 length:768 start_codon:yes stop_codon:yes gene_type:complete
MRTGIIQGRLTPPHKGFQECPKDWTREFDLLESLSLTHIEWIVTKKHFKENPIFHEDVSKYNVNSICADNLVDAKFNKKEYFFQNMVPICNTAINNEIKNITIPLLEESSVTHNMVRKQVCSYLKELSEMYKDLSFSIEAELEPDKLDEIININDNFMITYDTGNVTSFGLNHEEYIYRFGDKINNVHLKDRTFDAKTVFPLMGDTDFKQIFKYLNKINYDGVFTLQTARGPTGQEINTITKHKSIFEELYNEYA